MLSDLRRAIAMVLALLVTVLTLGRLEVSWSGKRGGLEAVGTTRTTVAHVVDRGGRVALQPPASPPVPAVSTKANP
jgi:hypothetical protein